MQPVDLVTLGGSPAASPAFPGLSVIHAQSVAEAVEMLCSGRALALLARFPLPDWSPEELAGEVQRRAPSVPLLIAHPAMSAPWAARLTRLGASQCLTASEDSAELRASLAAVLEEARARARIAPVRDPWKHLLIGESAAMAEVDGVVRLAGPRRSTVLITGETGTGKEMAARALHLASPRAQAPMVAVNCTALPENLLEAELFGHVRGAFTGAVNHRVGRFEQAHKGTLFLDEIADMPLELQAKLLRVLQERELQRLGSSEAVRVDVRVIAASNVSLPERVRQGRFREDLYYRLNVVPLHMPALRDRREDIPPLVHHFLAKVCRLEDLPLKTVRPEALERLAGHTWPGNVRELENAVEMAIVMSGQRRTLVASDFPLNPPSHGKVVSIRTGEPAIEETLDFTTAIHNLERQLIGAALEKAHGNKSAAAQLLGLRRTTLLAKLRNLEAAHSAYAGRPSGCAGLQSRRPG